MRLDTRNKAQADLCKAVTVSLNGKRRHDCVVADSDQGYIEIATGHRQVGVVTKAVLKRIGGVVMITLDGKVL